MRVQAVYTSGRRAKIALRIRLPQKSRNICAKTKYFEVYATEYGFVWSRGRVSPDKHKFLQRRINLEKYSTKLRKEKNRPRSVY